MLVIMLIIYYTYSYGYYTCYDYYYYYYYMLRLASMTALVNQHVCIWLTGDLSIIHQSPIRDYKRPQTSCSTNRRPLIMSHTMLEYLKCHVPQTENYRLPQALCSTTRRLLHTGSVMLHEQETLKHCAP